MFLDQFLDAAMEARGCPIAKSPGRALLLAFVCCILMQLDKRRVRSASGYIHGIM